MKVLIKQFLSQLHSWSAVGWGTAQALIEMGHEVDLFATDGNCEQHMPKDLLPHLIGFTRLNEAQIIGKIPSNDYDMNISYTCMKNFPYQLCHSKKNRFGQWAWEWSGPNSLPSGFAKHYKSCDMLCAPSNFCKSSFMQSGIPENHITVIPHGINANDFRKASKIDLKTNKKFKIGVVIAQNHLRKNIPGLLEAYGKAFTNKDDVCLILKAKDKPVVSPFEVSLKDCINRFNSKFPHHAELKVYSEFIPDMSDFYRSIDATYSMSNCEGYYMPGTESIAAGKLAIAPNDGGQLDFLNSSNALLIDGKTVRTNPQSMYWQSNPNATWFSPSINDAVEKLRYAYQHYESINAKVREQQESVLQEYDWKNIASKFLALCK